MKNKKIKEWKVICHGRNICITITNQKEARTYDLIQGRKTPRRAKLFFELKGIT